MRLKKIHKVAYIISVTALSQTYIFSLSQKFTSTLLNWLINFGLLPQNTSTARNSKAEVRALFPERMILRNFSKPSVSRRPPRPSTCTG